MNNQHGVLEGVEEKMDEVRRSAADSLESAADSVRTAGGQGAGVIRNLANGAGERLDATAAYVRAFEGGEPFTRLRLAVRRHPVGILALATAAGLAAGFLWGGSGRRKPA